MTIRYTLPNGLKVVFEEQHAAKVAAFQVWVGVGSADEGPEEIGLAHLHEHMLFKGTSKRGPGEIAHDIEAHGGEINAWTSFDQTVYHIVLASQYARHGLEVLADAIQNSAFDATELSREIEVVCEEIKRSLDSPSRRASKDLFSTAFTQHPYQRPVIGFEDSVRSHSRDKVLAFYRRHYTPRNMVLSVAADMTEKDLRQWVDELFGRDFGEKTFKPVTRPSEPPLTHHKILLRQDTVKEAYLNLAFHIPNASHADTPALDLLAMVAGQGDASRLSLRVKRKKSLVNDIHSYAYTPKDAGLWVTSLTLPPEKLRPAMEETLGVLAHLRQTPVTDDELNTLKALVESESVYQRETVQGMARKLGYYESSMGHVDEEARYLEKVAALTPEALLQAAQKYLNFDNILVTGLLPEQTAFTEADVEAILQRAKTEKPFDIEPRKTPKTSSAPLRVRTGTTDNDGKIIVEKLPNGATVVVRRESAVPLFAMRAVFQGGLRYENEGNNGLTTLLSRLWTRGTPQHDAEEISHLVDALSGTLSGMGGRNSLSLRGEFLSKHFERAFSLFSECLTHPTFPESEFERERHLILQDIHTRDDKPSGVAFELFHHTLFEKHPYRMSTLGETASVTQLTPAALSNYHAQYLDTSQMTFCVVGDVNVDEVLKKAHEAFGKSRGQALKAPAVPLEAAPQSPRMARRQLDKAQSHLVYGFQGLRVTSPERRALEVLSTVLSGQGGRLFVELRDKRSMAYSVSSFSIEGVDPGYFAVYIGTSPEKVKAALEGIRTELEKVRDVQISDVELRRAQEHLIGSHEIGLQRNGSRAALMALDTCYGIPADDFLKYADEIADVTKEKVQAVARQLIDFDKSVLAWVGP